MVSELADKGIIPRVWPSLPDDLKFRPRKWKIRIWLWTEFPVKLEGSATKINNQPAVLQWLSGRNPTGIPSASRCLFIVISFRNGVKIRCSDVQRCSVQHSHDLCRSKNLRSVSYSIFDRRGSLIDSTRRLVRAIKANWVLVKGHNDHSHAILPQCCPRYCGRCLRKRRLPQGQGICRSPSRLG